MTGISYISLVPDLIVAIGALVLLLWSAGHKDAERGDRSRSMAIAAVGVCVAGVLALIAAAMRAAPAAANGPLADDGYRWAIDGIVLIATALSAVLAAADPRPERRAQGESFALMLLSASGMMLLAGARDLIVVFLGIELMSIPAYVLAAIDRRSARSAEAGLKYFLLGAFSTAFLLYGVALVFGATGATDFGGIAAAVQNASGAGLALPPAVLSLGVGLLLVGLGFKVAAAPFHMWTPDVYEGAPTPYTAFMAAAIKAAGFAVLARVMFEAFGAFATRWHFAVWWMAAITMVVGNVVALAQRSVKRMLAYSSVAHAGYLLVAVVSDSAQGSSAIVFYLFAYSLATIGAFATLQVVTGADGRADTLDSWDGLFAERPALAVGMAVFMLALLGFPLAGGMGFFAKWYILQAALAPSAGRAAQSYLAVVLVVSSVISAGYYLNLVGRMFMRARPDGAPALASPSPWSAAVAAAAAVALLVLGVFPAPAVRLSRASALVVSGGSLVTPVARSAAVTADRPLASVGGTR